LRKGTLKWEIIILNDYYLPMIGFSFLITYLLIQTSACF
jgi:hypothetical protein